MALKDVLKPKSEEQIIEALNKANQDELEIVFESALNQTQVRLMELWLTHANDEEKRKIIQSHSNEINRLKQMVDLFLQLRIIDA